MEYLEIDGLQTVASCCHATDIRRWYRRYQWRRSVLNLVGVAGSRSEATALPQSILLFSFHVVDSAWVWAEPVHPLPNMLMQFMQSNSFIKFILMFNVQKSACMPLSAELILWITSHVEQHGTKKWGVRAHWDPHTARKWGGQDPRTPTGSPPLYATVFNGNHCYVDTHISIPTSQCPARNISPPRPYFI